MRRVKRIAVTVPPEGWFHGIARALFELYRGALVELGLEVFDVPVDAFLPPDATRLARLIPDLQAFRPQLVLGLPNGAYALICRMTAGRDGRRANVFTEVLDLPAICLWDQAPFELADQLLPHPLGPEASSDGADHALRHALSHPRVVHWSRDSGQTRLMERLGFAAAERVIQEGAPALPGFSPAARDGAEGVGFVGHIYPEAAVYPHPALTSLAGDAIGSWSERPGAALWDVLAEKIAAMPDGLRQGLALDQGQTYFWHFAHRLIVHDAQTFSRLKMLAAVPAPVACYGNFANLAAAPANVVAMPGGIPFGPLLAAALARHAVTVDVLNPASIEGYSHKPVLGFASGGFVLVNRRRDFVVNFGAAGEAVSYGDGEELGRKVEYFLAHAKERLEVGGEIRERIRARYQLRDVLSRVLNGAMELAGGVAPSPKPSACGAAAVVVRNLLPEVRVESESSGAQVVHAPDGVRIATPPGAWAYAAVVPVTMEARSLRDPHLRIKLKVETGRIGIAAMLVDDGSLAAEQLVSPSDAAATVTVELAHEGVDVVVVRNTVDGVSRAVVLEAALCDRLAPAGNGADRVAENGNVV